jgi:DNA-binding PadR family transcriptional regulator
MMTLNDQYQKLNQELRRGVLVLAVLSQLRARKYGYSLIEELTEGGLEIDQGTLYPLLRRLEDQGLLHSEWDVSGSRPRRYYELTGDGERALEDLEADWHALVQVVRGLLEKTELEE